MHDSRYYLINEQFDNITSVLLGEYWDDITLLQRGKSVKSALQQSPKELDKDNHSKAVKYFSHVIIYLSPEVIENDRRAHDSQKVTHLCEIFKGVHREHFSALTSATDGIRYQVLPGVGLSENQVVVTFGRCVYLPAEQQKPAYKLNFSVEDGSGSLSLPVFQNQRLALVNNNPYGAQQQFKDWPFSDNVSILILQNNSLGKLEILSEPEGALTVKADGSSDTSYSITDKAGQVVHLDVIALRSNQSNTEKKESYVVNESFEEEDDKSRALSLSARIGNGYSSTSNIKLDERTFMEGQPKVSMIELIGMPLQRLSKYQQYGFNRLRIGFSELGEVINPDNDLAVGILVLNMDDNLVLEKNGLFQPIQLPFNWKLSSSITININPPLPDLRMEYAAFIELAKPTSFNLSNGLSQTFGRGSAAQIAPRLLVDAQMLSDDASKPAESAEQLGFSREVAKFKVDDIGLEVLPMGSNYLWHLNSEGNIIARIEKYAAHILPSEFLLSGHYLFRYIA